MEVISLGDIINPVYIVIVVANEQTNYHIYELSFLYCFKTSTLTEVKCFYGSEQTYGVELDKYRDMN